MARGVKGTGPYSKQKKKTPTPITTTEGTPIPDIPKTKTKRSPNKRPLEELDRIDPTKMTPSETTTYIHSVRTALRMQEKKIEELHETCSKAFEQCRNLEKAYDTLKTRTNNKDQFIEQATKVFAKTISQTIAGGNY